MGLCDLDCIFGGCWDWFGVFYWKFCFDGYCGFCWVFVFDFVGVDCLFIGVVDCGDLWYFCDCYIYDFIFGVSLECFVSVVFL